MECEFRVGIVEGERGLGIGYFYDINWYLKRKSGFVFYILFSWYYKNNEFRIELLY